MCDSVRGRRGGSSFSAPHPRTSRTARVSEVGVGAGEEGPREESRDLGDVCGVPKTRLLSGWRFNRPVCVWGWGGAGRRRLWRRGEGEAPERFQISLVPAPRPPRPRPGSEWLRQGRPRAGAGRVPGRGYKGTRHRPLPTHSCCRVLPAPLHRSSRTPSLARLQLPSWTPRAPPDGRHRFTGRQAGRQAGERAAAPGRHRGG